MSTQTATDRARGTQERRLLLAVDETEGSRRAVMYVADFFGDYRGVSVTLFSIVAEPPEDFFSSDQERRQWREDQTRSREGVLADYRRILAGAGIDEERIETHLSVRQCASIGDAILAAQDAWRCCIVVLGRRGLSHDEEFLLGSTTSRIVHHAKRCAVLVVE